MGYDLTHLIVGSEGTFGVVTKIFLKLIPKPQALLTLLAYFRSVGDATDAVARVMGRGILPCAIEFVDQRSMEIMREHFPFSLPEEAESLLLIEVDGFRDLVHQEAETIGDICLETNALDAVFVEGTRKREALWEVRRKVSTLIEEKAPLYVSEDIVVPIALITDFVSHCQKMEEKYGIRVYTFGHAGDGNIHLMMTAAEKTEETEKNMERAVEEVFRITLEMGGTISGEHGVGLVNRPFVSMELSEESIRIQKQIKSVFDPFGIMNPGKIFSQESGDRRPW